MSATVDITYASSDEIEFESDDNEVASGDEDEQISGDEDEEISSDNDPVAMETSPSNKSMETTGDTDTGQSESDAESCDENSLPHQGLANVMAKILNKKIESNKVILVKGNTDKEILERKRKREKLEKAKGGIEVVGETAAKVSRGENGSSGSDSDEDPEVLREKRIKKKLWEDMGRVKPEVLEKDKERAFQKIATRGVVQLFNAVQKQQKVIEDKLTEAGKSERKKDNALKSMTKGQFLDVLKGTAVKETSKSRQQKSKDDDPADNAPSWSILRDDFMTGAKMKDWDRESDESDGSDGEQAAGDMSSGDSDT